MRHDLKHRWSVGHNYLTGITFGKWCKLLTQNGFQISPAYLHRFAAITMASLSNSVFAGVEAWRYGTAIKQAPTPKAPIFILGHWRSGTTYLHELLAQDSAQFHYPNTYQVVNPYTFLTTENVTTRMFPWLVPEKRPMDNMALKFDSPQEDEFAPLLMTLTSLYLGISFPRRMAHYDRYMTFRGVDPAELAAWKAAFLTFCKKLSLGDTRRLLIKSPPHTARIRILLDMFPDARFIHIHRDPYRVFQSQRHFFDTAGWYSYLQKPDLTAIDEGILRRHETMYDAYFDDLPLIPQGNFHEIRFDALEADPVGEIAKTYEALSLDGFDSFAPVLRRYVDGLKGYEKNQFDGLDPAAKAMVADRWARSFDKGNYPR
ncbi:sulfotransferase [Pseudorhodobacter turbinis]|uniref:Sulfotransferase n=1 Tax=Pseudorhodobacter turbinis TaxID=2500533 RepID=A0A4P8EDM9_9RHOB|nr:sulfotransferase [Pseudorhodobacter turbinis]QCO55081.1 sulfotransferase [Pseudorhodobacter turbinis]